MMSSVMNVDGEDTLVLRRPKRSTAGNRMEAALAELGLEDLTKEAEDDKEFFVEKDEEDIFGSDFESTDEEAAQADVDAGDNAVNEEEKRARKSVKTRLEKTTAAAHARNKVTFNPQASTSTSQAKAKRRVWFADGGKILDDEDGGEDDRHEGASSGTADVSPKGKKKGKGKGKGKRQSRRSHTVLNTSATVSRMRSAEKRRATNPKKQPTIQKSYTQAQLLSRALDTEEGNIMEHRDYLQMEEEKRRRARVVRKVVEGPKIRWVSRGEEVRVHVPVPVPAPVPYGYTGGSGYYSYQAVGGQHYPNVVPNTSGSGTTYYPNVGTNQPSTPLSLSTSTTVLNPTPVYYPNQTQQQQPQTSYYYPAHPASQQHLPQPATRLEKVCKNYVVHEVSQGQSQMHPTLKPAWEETMIALFGGDVKWEDLKVWSGKTRPLSRVKQTCPLTGLPAPYLDPRTNVPFANMRAYDTLTKVLKHEYVWSERLGCYLNKEGERRAMGIEGRVKKAKEKGKEKAWGLVSDAMDVS